MNAVGDRIGVLPRVDMLRCLAHMRGPAVHAAFMKPLDGFL